MFKLKKGFTYLSLFSGIGAFEKVFNDLSLDPDLIGFSEIDKHAIKAYTHLHNIPLNKSLGDITKIDLDSLPKDIDFVSFGFPCQSISVSGNMEGFKKESGTRSSLLWEVMKLTELLKPKFLIAENVKNLVEAFLPDFMKWIDYLSTIGYKAHWFLMSSSEYGAIQDRHRVFVLIVRKETFKFRV